MGDRCGLNCKNKVALRLVGWIRTHKSNENMKIKTKYVDEDQHQRWR